MAPCNWVLSTGCCPDWESYDPAIQLAAASWASGILDALTGRRFSQCDVTVRPCGPKCQGWSGYMTYPAGAPSAVGAWGAWMVPYVDGTGTWRNCACPGSCSCRATCEVPLPTPVAAVTSVTVDGVLLPSSAYRLDNGRILVRTDGDCWPDCQDMDLAITEPGTFAVTYQPGELLSSAGMLAAGRLACEFAKACVGSADCQLPGQLQSLTRSGVSVEIVDPSTFLENGLTGIADVDLWVRSVNPHQLGARPRVYSPDIRTPRFVQ